MKIERQTWQIPRSELETKVRAFEREGRVNRVVVGGLIVGVAFAFWLSERRSLAPQPRTATLVQIVEPPSVNARLPGAS